MNDAADEIQVQHVHQWMNLKFDGEVTDRRCRVCGVQDKRRKRIWG